MTELVLPSHTNALGTIFGGVAMSWMDIAAATAAMRFSKRTCVTASVDELHFLHAIKLGWIVTIQAVVNCSFKTSMEVGVRIDVEDPRTGSAYHTASAYFTFVALDDFGKPYRLKPAVAETPEEIRRMNEATIRRTHRLEAANNRKMRENNPGGNPS